jgi:hypothetical protein
LIGSLEKCKLIDFPKITDPRGNITFIGSNKEVPFEYKNLFYIYDIPTGVTRGSHAQKNTEEVLICLSGSFDINFDDGFNKKTINLNRPWQGVYISPLIWSYVSNFNSGSIGLGLFSDFYNESGYIRDYDDFLNIVHNQK